MEADRRERDVIAAEQQVRVLYAGLEVACHAQNIGRRATVIERAHLAGIVGCERAGVSWLVRPSPAESFAQARTAVPAELLRPLTEYESVLGGRW